MADCEINPMLSPYYDGELDEADRRRVEMHLRFCPQCAAEVEKMRLLSAALASMAVPLASPALVTRIESQSKRLDELTLARFVRRLTAVAAAVLALAVCRWTIDRPAEMFSPPTLSTWERAAIDPNPGTPDPASVASIDNPFDEFIARDLSGGVQ